MLTDIEKFQRAWAEINGPALARGEMPSGFRPGSRQATVAQLLTKHGLNPEVVMEYISVGRGQFCWTYPTGEYTRAAYPVGSPSDDSMARTQYGKTRKLVYAVRRAMLADRGSR
jgi:hypothetical protein